MAATSVLAAIPVENEHRGGFSRTLFPTWLDVDGQGCDARQVVLRRELLRPIGTGVEPCAVTAGPWESPYDGVTVFDPAQVEVDHVVSLKEAWDSGAWAWPPERRMAFANDVSDARTLRAVSAVSNRAKGDADPSNWMPPRTADWCRYLGDWVAVKARWGLKMDRSEAGRVRKLLTSRCPGLTIAASPPLPDPPAVSGGPDPTAAYYPTCAAARAAGAAPLRRGDPGYRTSLDGDGDGIACEPPKPRP